MKRFLEGIACIGLVLVLGLLMLLAGKLHRERSDER